MNKSGMNSDPILHMQLQWLLNDLKGLWRSLNALGWLTRALGVLLVIILVGLVAQAVTTLPGTVAAIEINVVMSVSMMGLAVGLVAASVSYAATARHKVRFAKGFLAAAPISHARTRAILAAAGRRAALIWSSPLWLTAVVAFASWREVAYGVIVPVIAIVASGVGSFFALRLQDRPLRRVRQSEITPGAKRLTCIGARKAPPILAYWFYQSGMRLRLSLVLLSVCLVSFGLMSHQEAGSILTAHPVPAAALCHFIFISFSARRQVLHSAILQLSGRNFAGLLVQSNLGPMVVSLTAYALCWGLAIALREHFSPMADGVWAITAAILIIFNGLWACVCAAFVVRSIGVEMLYLILASLALAVLLIMPVFGIMLTGALMAVFVARGRRRFRTGAP